MENFPSRPVLGGGETAYVIALIPAYFDRSTSRLDVVPLNQAPASIHDLLLDGSQESFINLPGGNIHGLPSRFKLAADYNHLRWRENPSGDSRISSALSSRGCEVSAWVHNRRHARHGMILT